jgi:hypothetical protein
MNKPVSVVQCVSQEKNFFAVTAVSWCKIHFTRCSINNYRCNIHIDNEPMISNLQHWHSHVMNGTKSKNSIWTVLICTQQEMNYWKWCFLCSLCQSCTVMNSLYSWQRSAANYWFAQRSHTKRNPFSQQRGPISKHINSPGKDKNMVMGPKGAWNQE